MDGFDIVIYVAIPLFLAGLILGYIITEDSFVSLSHETANSVCFNLTGINGTVGEAGENRVLICKTPSFDSTQNIIIKTNGDSK